MSGDEDPCAGLAALGMRESLQLPASSPEAGRSLEVQRHEFAARPLLATPIAGTIMWAVAGVAGLFPPSRPASLVLFVATGMIAYLGMFISRFTGENFLDRSGPKNAFDALFLYTVAMAVLAYALRYRHIAERTAVKLDRGEGHFVFVGECALPLEAQGVRLCPDRQGIDRKAVHDDLGEIVSGFLAGHLGKSP